MNQNVIYVGIDVDDVSYHGSALTAITVLVRKVMGSRRNGSAVNSDS